MGQETQGGLMSKPMSTERIVEIDMLLEAATDGPWYLHERSIMRTSEFDPVKGGLDQCIAVATVWNANANAALIAATPTVIAELLTDRDYWRDMAMNDRAEADE